MEKALEAERARASAAAEEACREKAEASKLRAVLLQLRSSIDGALGASGGEEAGVAGGADCERQPSGDLAN